MHVYAWITGYALCIGLLVFISVLHFVMLGAHAVLLHNNRNIYSWREILQLSNSGKKLTNPQGNTTKLQDEDLSSSAAD